MASMKKKAAGHARRRAASRSYFSKAERRNSGETQGRGDYALERDHASQMDGAAVVVNNDSAPSFVHPCFLAFQYFSLSWTRGVPEPWCRCDAFARCDFNVRGRIPHACFRSSLPGSGSRLRRAVQIGAATSEALAMRGFHRLRGNSLLCREDAPKLPRAAFACIRAGLMQSVSYSFRACHDR